MAIPNSTTDLLKEMCAIPMSPPQKSTHRWWLCHLLVSAGELRCLRWTCPGGPETADQPLVTYWSQPAHLASQASFKLKAITFPLILLCFSICTQHEIEEMITVQHLESSYLVPGYKVRRRMSYFWIETILWIPKGINHVSQQFLRVTTILSLLII